MPYLLALTFVLLPAYAWHVKFLGLPANILMLWIFALWLIFVLYLQTKNQFQDFLTGVKKTDQKILWLTGLFFFAGIISLFTAGLNQKTLGEFLVIFVQPISLYFIGKFIFEKYPAGKDLLINTCYILLALSGAYAVVQYFNGLGLPLLFQGNDFEPRRAISFFIHPNFYALWCAPLLALVLPNLTASFKQKISGDKYLKTIAWLLGSFGLLLSLSRAGWIGLAAAIIIYAIIGADRKTRQSMAYGAIIIAITVLMIPKIRHRLTAPFYGEKSASSRITLWESGIKAIKQSPITGLGLGGYEQKYRTLISDQSLPDHNFPHNIFLDLWVETGIIGLVTLVDLIVLIMYYGFKNRRNTVALGVSLFLACLIAQGQIDNPYFKNDLAAAFWLIIALL